MSSVIPEVGDCMTPGPHFLAPNDTLSQARRLMREYGIRHLPVMRGRELVGILSEREVSLVAALLSVPPESIPVEDAMTSDPYAVAPSAPLNLVARTMAERKLGSAVVLDGGAVVGVFTTTDALHALADSLEGKLVRRTYEAVPTAPPAGRRSSERDVP